MRYEPFPPVIDFGEITKQTAEEVLKLYREQGIMFVQATPPPPDPYEEWLANTGWEE